MHHRYWNIAAYVMVSIHFRCATVGCIMVNLMERSPQRNLFKRTLTDDTDSLYQTQWNNLFPLFHRKLLKISSVDMMFGNLAMWVLSVKHISILSWKCMKLFIYMFYISTVMRRLIFVSVIISVRMTVISVLYTHVLVEHCKS